MNDSPPLIYGWTLVAVVLGPVAILAVVAFFVERQREPRTWRGSLTAEEREAVEGVILILRRLNEYPCRPLKTREDDINALVGLLERLK